ncbi:MAG: YfiR family protein [Gemmatimonadota bacterium]
MLTHLPRLRVIWFSRAAGLRVACLLGCVMGFPRASQAQERSVAAEESSIEYQVKAAYLLNFTRYVEWPRSAFSSASAPLDICIFGDDPFGLDLDRASADRSSGGHPIRVRRERERSRLTGCHLVFVGEREGHLYPEVGKQLTEKGMLTVGNNEQFARVGGIIGFVIVNETVRFVVNLEAQDRAGLRISSRVLTLANALIPAAGGGY